MNYDIPFWPPVTLEKDEIKALLEEALSIDGAHHKQWYIWQLAKALEIDLSGEWDKDYPEPEKGKRHE